MDNFTVNDFLEEREVGTILPLIVNVEGDDIPIFFIKDQRKTIEKINEDEFIAMKNSILGDKKCFLLLMLFKFNDNFNTTYDVWFNYGYDWHRDFLEILRGSERLIIDFRDESNNRVKTIEMKNEIGETLREYINKCEEFTIVKDKSEDSITYILNEKRYKSWSDNDADIMLDSIFESYESIEELWKNV